MDLLAAGWGPQGPLIENDEVAALVREHPSRLVGLAAADLGQSMDAVRGSQRSESHRRMFLYENATRLFKLDAAS